MVQRRDVIASLGGAALVGCAHLPNGYGHFAAAHSSLALSDEFDDVLARIVSQMRTTAGVAVAVATPDGAYSRGLGMADVEAGIAADSATSFYVASATKPITALALATQIGRNGFDFDMPIAAFAPAAPLPQSIRDAGITFRHLLTHTSAIRNEPIGYRLAFTGQHDPDTLWSLLATSRFDPAAVGQFRYTNIGYNIATILTDAMWGESWQTVLDRVLFLPLGMTSTSARRSSVERRNRLIARPHAATPNGVVLLPLEKTDATMQSAGGVMMSADDAVRWLQMLINAGRAGGRQMLPERMFPALFARAAQVDSIYEGFRRDGYGLGWYLGPLNGEPLAHHFGSFAGARAHMSIMQHRRIGVFVAENESSAVPMVGNIFARFAYARLIGDAAAYSQLTEDVASAVALRDRYFNALTAELARRAARPWQLGHSLDAYVGQYHNAEMGTMTVGHRRDTLHVAYGILSVRGEPAGQPESIRVELVPQSGSILTFLGSPPNALRFNDYVFTKS